MRLNRSVFSGLQRSVATILTIALPLYTASAHAVPPGDDTPRNPPAEGQRTATETPGAAVPMGELSNEADGKVKVTEWKDDNGHRQKVRLDVEDATIAERMEIDGKRGAIEIAGVSFRPVTDPATGRPSAVVVGDAVEEATYVVSGQTTQPGSESDQRAMERISKRFNAANGSARIAHMKDVMQSVLPARGQRVAFEGWRTTLTARWTSSPSSWIGSMSC